MDDNNRNQHPFLAALKMFEAAARSAFDTAAAFWRPWSGRREKQEAAAKQQQSNAPSEQARQPIKRDQEVTVRKEPKAPTKRAKSPKPLVQEAMVEKTPKAPTKRSLKQEQELEQEERAQKTERLRKLRLAKEAADRKKNPSGNGRDEGQHAIKK
jgi:hypothetical protein